MYTQCPSCSATFRVTADVLRVAGGRVRCGSCGAAFNALNHLSEQRPEPVPPPAAERLQLESKKLEAIREKIRVLRETFSSLIAIPRRGLRP